MQSRTVPSYPQFQATDRGTVIGPRGKETPGSVMSGGYLRVTTTVNGKRTTLGVNRLVCEAFHGPAPTPQHEAAHADGDLTNNRPGNLRWATSKQNHADRRRHGTDAIGERNGRALLTDEQVRSIRRRYVSGINQHIPGNSQQLAERFGVTQNLVTAIVRREAWPHLI